MGREKTKGRREKPAYVVHEYQGEQWPISLPPPILDLPPSLVPEVEQMIRDLKTRGQSHPRVIAIVSHRSKARR